MMSKSTYISSKTKIPERYPDCARYHRCLAAAAQANILFGCIGCDQYTPLRPWTDILETKAIARLLGAVFSAQAEDDVAQDCDAAVE